MDQLEEEEEDVMVLLEHSAFVTVAGTACSRLMLATLLTLLTKLDGAWCSESPGYCTRDG